MDDMKKALLTLAEGLPEEAWLKEHLSELSAKETIQLTAAVMKDAPKTGKDALECVLTAPAYEVWYPAGSYAELGSHYLKHEAEIPKDLLPYMDLDALGQLCEDENPGVFVGDCYVVYPNQASMQMNRISVHDVDWSVKLKLSSSEKPDGVWLRLPDCSMLDDGAPADETVLALHSLGATELQDCHLLEAKCVLPQAGDLMAQYSDLSDLIYDGNDLGFVLDEQGQGMPDFMERFTSALDFEGCCTLKQVLDVAQNLHCYDYVKADKVEIYAQEELKKAGVDLSSAPLADACIDYQEYGADLLDEQGYQLTTDGSGYIRRNEQEFFHDRTDPEWKMDMC